MDLLLTHGYYLGEDPAENHPYPPLGLLYLSSHLRRCGLDVGVFDTTFSSPEGLRRHLAAHRPPVVGIYGNLMTRANVLAATRDAKAGGALVVLGGPEPFSYAGEYLSRGADVVVKGEGELTLQELVPHLLAHGAHGLDAIQGIAFRTLGGEVRETAPRPLIADLDAQPFPDRGAIDLAPYFDTWRRHTGRSAVSLVTARGCAYQCTWCSHGVYGFTHRRRSPRNVADELESIVAAYAPDIVWYTDDVFTVHKRWLGEYAAELRARGLRVPFEAISREDRLDEEVVALLAGMGCFRLWVGAESGSQRVLDAMKRRTDAARTRDAIRLLQRHGIEAGTFIMLGYEGETMADIEATLAHLDAARPDTFLTTVAYPIKGTEYYRTVADRIVAPGPWDAITDRELTVAGRPSRRHYRFAIRWIVNQVAWAKERARPRPDPARLLKTYASARIGRLGMLLTRHQVEPYR